MDAQVKQSGAAAAFLAPQEIDLNGVVFEVGGAEVDIGAMQAERGRGFDQDVVAVYFAHFKFAAGADPEGGIFVDSDVFEIFGPG